MALAREEVQLIALAFGNLCGHRTFVVMTDIVKCRSHTPLLEPHSRICMVTMGEHVVGYHFVPVPP